MARTAIRLLLTAVLAAAAHAGDFLPMMPMETDLVPIHVSVDGGGETARRAREQLGMDIALSGLLRLSDADESYASAEVEVSRTAGGVRLSARLLAGGELVLQRQYGGSSVYPLVHALSDDMVYVLTGERGIASTRVAYVRRDGGSYALVVKSLDPREGQVVLADDEVITTPAWSPDGGQVALTSYRSGSADLYLYDFGTGRAGKLLAGNGLYTSPAWSPDGSAIAVTRSRESNSDIYLLDTASGEARRLTARPSIETAAGFSPNGQQMIFTSDRLGFPQLYTMDSSGGSAVRLTGVHRYMDSPAWSPAGDRIAYAARVGGDFHIFVMDADGSNVRQVTFEGSLNENPVWSPTGRHLAFSSDRDGERAIYVLELSGLEVIRLSGDGECYLPTWSPLSPADDQGIR